MNAITCLTCGTRLVSRTRHDFQRCPCEDITTMVAVDGGHDYSRLCLGVNASWMDEDGTKHGPLAEKGAATA